MGDLLDDDNWESGPLASDSESDLDYDTNFIEDIEDDLDDTRDSDSIKEQSKMTKRKRKIDLLKEKKKKRRQEAEEAGTDLFKSTLDQQMSGVEMCELIQMTRSSIFPHEEDDKDFKPSDFFMPSLPSGSTTESTTKTLCPFIRALSVSMPNYRKILTEKKSLENGNPELVIICASATRATQIIRNICARIPHCKIAKLFGKHFKVSEHIELLSSDYFPAVIGTPHRLQALIDLGALSLSSTQVALIDYTTDVKKFTILTLPEVSKDFIRLSYSGLYKEKRHMKIAFVKDIFVEPKNEVKKEKLPNKKNRIGFNANKINRAK